MAVQIPRIDNNRIKFALYLPGWNSQGGCKATLQNNARRILTTEYIEVMKGGIFCPECCSDLFRSPELGERDVGGRPAYFAHARGSLAKCSLRTVRREGNRFDSEEEAAKAVDDELLVLISGFMAVRPEPIQGVPRQFNGPLVEDLNGPLADGPISRHTGRAVKLPSRITTIRGICRSFDRNFYKYYMFAGAQFPVQLRDLLVDVSTVTEVDGVPRFYYGRIISSAHMGPNPWNLRLTWFDYAQMGYKDFCLKAPESDCAEHGIKNDSVGRVVVMYGVITESGIGLCLENLGWGEYALLPVQYERLLYEE
ncbi:hypothetical protein D3C77_219940 [compost metagenome]